MAFEIYTAFPYVPLHLVKRVACEDTGEPIGGGGDIALRSSVQGLTSLKGTRILLGTTAAALLVRTNRLFLKNWMNLQSL